MDPFAGIGDINKANTPRTLLITTREDEECPYFV
jgi:hypothetical protein